MICEFVSILRKFLISLQINDLWICEHFAKIPNLFINQRLVSKTSRFLVSLHAYYIYYIVLVQVLIRQVQFSAATAWIVFRFVRHFSFQTAWTTIPPFNRPIFKNHNHPRPPLPIQIRGGMQKFQNPLLRYVWGSAGGRALGSRG